MVGYWKIGSIVSKEMQNGWPSHEETNTCYKWTSITNKSEDIILVGLE